MTLDIGQRIVDALGQLKDQDLGDASITLLNTLGYASEKTLNISSLVELREHLDPKGFLTEENALLSRWLDVRFLFQLTNTEISARTTG